ncbi:MAG: hypothetical protein V3V41_07870 [Candidatus Heimdallarchaeota archaeon]
MTIVADIAKIGTYLNIQDAIDVALKQANIYFNGTLTEGLDTDWDVIILTYATYLLDRHVLQKKSKADNTVVVPPLFPDFIRDMMKALRVEDVDSNNVANVIPVFQPSSNLKWDV